MKMARVRSPIRSAMPRPDHRVVEAGGDPHPLEQATRQVARRVIGAVDQQQLVARRQDGEQRVEMAATPDG